MPKKIFEELTPEFILEYALKELSEAQEAQKKGKPFPDLKLIALLLIEGEFNRIPVDLWKNLGFVLIGKYRNRRGRPSTGPDDLTLAREYKKLRINGYNDREAISFLAKTRNHSDERSTRRALARGRKYEANEENWFRQYLIDHGLIPTGNSPFDVPAVALDDKKE